MTRPKTSNIFEAAEGEAARVSMDEVESPNCQTKVPGEMPVGTSANTSPEAVRITT
jgi:hypothetical protein